MSIGKIQRVAAVADFQLVLVFDDGVEETVDLAELIHSQPTLAALAEPAAFRGVRQSDDGWSVEWPQAGIEFGSPQLQRWADEQAGRTMSAAAFRDWMKRSGLTLDRAAEELGLSRRTVAYYLSGEQPVPRTVMLATEGLAARQVA